MSTDPINLILSLNVSYFIHFNIQKDILCWFQQTKFFENRLKVQNDHFLWSTMWYKNYENHYQRQNQIILIVLV